MNEIWIHQNDFWPLFEAVPRQELTDAMISYGVFVSFCLVAFAKFAKSSIFHVLLRMFIRNNSINQLMRENYNTLRLTDFILLLNFWLTCSLGSILFMNIQGVSIWVHFIWPIVLHLFLLLPLFLTSFVSGNKTIIRENTYNLFLLPQFVSLILLPLVLIGHLNTDSIVLLGWIYVVLLLLMFLFINYRAFVFAFHSGISLYYIILYICTLEFLPLSVFFNAFIANR